MQPLSERSIENLCAEKKRIQEARDKCLGVFNGAPVLPDMASALGMMDEALLKIDEELRTRET